MQEWTASAKPRPAAFEWSDASGALFAAGGAAPAAIHCWDLAQERCLAQARNAGSAAPGSASHNFISKFLHRVSCECLLVCGSNELTCHAAHAGGAGGRGGGAAGGRALRAAAAGRLRGRAPAAVRPARRARGRRHAAVALSLAPGARHDLPYSTLLPGVWCDYVPEWQASAGMPRCLCISFSVQVFLSTPLSWCPRHHSHGAMARSGRLPVFVTG